MIVFIANSRSPEADERATANEEWWPANEPRLAALETKVVEQATRLELAEGEKSQITGEMADLREKLVRAKERLAELEATNVTTQLGMRLSRAELPDKRS